MYRRSTLAIAVALWLTCTVPSGAGRVPQECAANSQGILILTVDAVSAPFVRHLIDRFIQVALADPRPPAIGVNNADGGATVRFNLPAHA